MLRAASRGGWIGAAAAACVATGDLAGSWSTATDRFGLALALIGLLVPCGAALGALLGAYGALVTAAIRRRIGDPSRESRLWPAPFVLLVSPLLAALAWQAFSGGSASRLPYRELFVVLAFAALALGLYAALRVGRAIVERASARLAWLTVITLLLGHAALTAADLWVLPGLYDGLHALAAAIRWLSAGLAIVLVAQRAPALLRLEARFPRLGLIAVAASLGLMVANLETVSARQTVRLAMLSPRAPAARTLMMELAPMLAPGDRPAARPRPAPEPRPVAVDGPAIAGAHLLLITIDALRADHVGAYGYRERPTSPALDHLAADSIVFERAYAPAPHSSYSLSSLMTSDYLYQRADLDRTLPEDTLATALRAAGYRTVALYTEGIFHTAGERLAPYRDGGFGFERHIDLLAGGAEAKTDEALALLDAMALKGEPPTFVWVHYFDVHEPYEDTRFGDRAIERYDSEIRRVDAEVDRLITEARARLRRPVIVALTADHGEEFGDHGGVYHGSTVYDEQVRVPLIVSAPGRPPRRVAAPVGLVDLAPTLLGLLDVATPPTMRGEDLRPLFSAEPERSRSTFASAGTRHMVLRWPFKLIEDLRFGTRELFDLGADPGERANLADERPERVELLRGEIRAWLDGLADDAVDPHRVAVYRGRLRDRRAIPGLAALVGDPAADPVTRAEAARLLGGLPHRTSRAALGEALDAPAPVAREAAIALGHLRDDRALEALGALVEEDDPDLRMRASLALAHLGEASAVPGLLEGIAGDRPNHERVEAIRLLGRLGDARSVEPLVDLLGDHRLGRRAAIALGRIGDDRARGPLAARLEDTDDLAVRDAIARAFGQLGDVRDVPRLVRLVARAEAPSASESLVRMGAVGEAIGGVDVRPGLRRASGLRACRARSLDDEWRYLGRTTCQTRRARVTLPLEPAPMDDDAEHTVVLRARRVDDGHPARVLVRLGAGAPHELRVDGEWRGHSWPAPPGRHERVTIEVDDADVRLELDHLLLVPVRPDVAGSGAG